MIMIEVRDPSYSKRLEQIAHTFEHVFPGEGAFD